MAQHPDPAKGSDDRPSYTTSRDTIGFAVLPCFVGDATAGLVRRGGLIGELETEQWLALNEADRHLPGPRLVIDRTV